MRKAMRRTISFLLVLALGVSLACTAFAAVPSSGESGTPTQKPTNSGEIPKTGDIIMQWVIIMVIALIILIAVILIYRKKFKK